MISSKSYARIARTGLLTVLGVSFAGNAGAHVVRLVVEKKESPAYKAQSFGKAGQYEILLGHFYGEIDPNDPVNLVINDIRLATRNARGMVEYSATFEISKPIDMSKSSGVLLYTVVNRGNGCPQKIPEANCKHNVYAYNDGHVGSRERLARRPPAKAGRADTGGAGREKSGWIEHHRAGDGEACQYAGGRQDRKSQHARLSDGPSSTASISTRAPARRVPPSSSRARFWGKRALRPRARGRCPRFLQSDSSSGVNPPAGQTLGRPLPKSPKRERGTRRPWKNFKIPRWRFGLISESLTRAFGSARFSG